MNARWMESAMWSQSEEAEYENEKFPNRDPQVTISLSNQIWVSILIDVEFEQKESSQPKRERLL